MVRTGRMVPTQQTNPTHQIKPPHRLNQIKPTHRPTPKNQNCFSGSVAYQTTRIRRMTPRRRIKRRIRMIQGVKKLRARARVRVRVQALYPLVERHHRHHLLLRRRHRRTPRQQYPLTQSRNLHHHPTSPTLPTTITYGTAQVTRRKTPEDKIK
jgi:hypothetical protein